MGMRVHVDLKEMGGEEYLWVTFNYTAKIFSACKGIRHYHFVPEDKGGPAFRYPMTLEKAKELREVFEDLTMSKECKRWAQGHHRQTKALSKMSTAETAELERLPDVLPKLHDLCSTRPFQLADIAYMAHAPSSMNWNEPGTGKTVEMIGAVFEASLDTGPNLVVAPVSSLEPTWMDHLLRFDQPHPVLVAPPGRANRIAVMQRAMDYADDGEPFWLVINPAMIQLNSVFERCEDHTDASRFKRHQLRSCPICHEENWAEFPEMEFIDWNTTIFDEFHLAGLGNPQSLTYKGFKRLKSKKMIAASGSPIGGKPVKLFGPLSLMYPKVFTSRLRFEDDWLQVQEERTRDGASYRKVRGIKPWKEEEFWKMMSSYALRRTMDEIAHDMPEINTIDVWVDMNEAQAKQYNEFANEAEVRIDDYELSAVGILAEYQRLKQFANAEQSVEVLPQTDADLPPKLRTKPTTNTPKMPAIEALLAERGIVPGEDLAAGPGVIIGSESERFISMIHRELNLKGIVAGKITGPTTVPNRNKQIKEFQNGDYRVMCMSTQAGGVSISLDAANTVIVLDETWNPDDQYQLIRRARRLSKIQVVHAYFIRTNKTIQEYIQKRVQDKSEINDRVVDFRKNGLFRP